MELPSQLLEELVHRGQILHSDIFEDKDEQLLMQYPLFKRDYKFLSHDSYICATNIVKLPKSVIVRTSRLFIKKDKITFFY